MNVVTDRRFPGVYTADPVEFTMNWASTNNTKVAFICAANEKRPGGDWETGVVGYEERLCRRSSLSATLATPGPAQLNEAHYPIPLEGGIYSGNVGELRASFFFHPSPFKRFLSIDSGFPRTA